MSIHAPTQIPRALSWPETGATQTAPRSAGLADEKWLAPKAGSKEEALKQPHSQGIKFHCIFHPIPPIIKDEIYIQSDK